MDRLRQVPLTARLLFALAVGVIAILIVVRPTTFSGTPSHPTPTTLGNHSTTSSTPQETGIKPVLAGVLDREGPPTPGAAVQGFVINVDWSDIQPTGPDELVTTALDGQLALASQRHLAVKLRLNAGIKAPDWIKTMTGPPVSVIEPVSGRAGTVGRYWTASFRQAYDSLMAKLAAKYDEIPELREVAVSRCSTVFSETFLRNARDLATVSALVSAGLTVDQDKACIRDEIDANQVWRKTRTGIAFNPFQAIQPDRSNRVDEAFTEQMMDYCRRSLGQRCVLENNSLRSPPLTGYKAMYAHMQQLGKPIGFQTAALPRIGDLVSTLALAANLGASAVELPAGYDAQAVPDPAVTALQANASG